MTTSKTVFAPFPDATPVLTYTECYHHNPELEKALAHWSFEMIDLMYESKYCMVAGLPECLRKNSIARGVSAKHPYGNPNAYYEFQDGPDSLDHYVPPCVVSFPMSLRPIWQRDAHGQLTAIIKGMLAMIEDASKDRFRLVDMELKSWARNYWVRYYTLPAADTVFYNLAVLFGYMGTRDQFDVDRPVARKLHDMGLIKGKREDGTIGEMLFKPKHYLDGYDLGFMRNRPFDYIARYAVDARQFSQGGMPNRLIPGMDVYDLDIMSSYRPLPNDSFSVRHLEGRKKKEEKTEKVQVILKSSRFGVASTYKAAKLSKGPKKRK